MADFTPTPGDIITVRGTVKRVHPGVGVLVELESKGDQYDAWIREDHVIARLVEAEDADEPPLYAYVEVVEEDGRVQFWKRYGPGWVAVGATNHPTKTDGYFRWRDLKATAASWTRLYRDGEI